MPNRDANKIVSAQVLWDAAEKYIPDVAVRDRILALFKERECVTFDMIKTLADEADSKNIAPGFFAAITGQRPV